MDAILCIKRENDMGKDKEKKVTFSEEIDSSIDGFALGITFVLLAFFEVYFKIFGNRLVEIILAIGLLLFGIFGTLTEIGKISTDKIKGVDDLVAGLIIAIIPILIILKFDILILNIIMFIVLAFGTFGAMKGVIEILYSLKIKRRKTENKKVEIMKIIVAVTEVVALAVAIIQFVNEVSV